MAVRLSLRFASSIKFPPRRNAAGERKLYYSKQIYTACLMVSLHMSNMKLFLLYREYIHNYYIILSLCVQFVSSYEGNTCLALEVLSLDAFLSAALPLDAFHRAAPPMEVLQPRIPVMHVASLKSVICLQITDLLVIFIFLYTCGCLSLYLHASVCRFSAIFVALYIILP